MRNFICMHWSVCIHSTWHALSHYYLYITTILVHTLVAMISYTYENVH